MRKLKTRLISAALAAAMMLSICPASAFAADGTVPESATSSSSSPVKLTPDQMPDDGSSYVIGSNHAAKYQLEAGDYTCGISIDHVAAEDTITIHLNGNINVTNAGIFIGVFSPCTLILDGNGTITNNSGNCIYAGTSGAKITINGGTYITKEESGTAIVGGEGVTIAFHGGTVSGSDCGIAVKNGATVSIGNVNFEGNTEDVHLSYGATFELTSGYQNTHKIKVGLDSSEYEYFRGARKITTNSTESMLNYVISAKEGYAVRYCDGTSEPDPGDSGETGGGGMEWGGGNRGDFEEGGGGRESSLNDSDHPIAFSENGEDETPAANGYLYLVKSTHSSEPIETPAEPGNWSRDVGGALATAILAAGAGAASYELGVHLYRKYAMNIDYWPKSRLEMARTLWEQADRPTPVSTGLFEDIDADDADAQMAARWCVEQELIKVSEDTPTQFCPGKAVTRLRICLTWHDAQQKGLIQ